jgi:hypothetical protein
MWQTHTGCSTKCCSGRSMCYTVVLQHGTDVCTVTMAVAWPWRTGGEAGSGDGEIKAARLGSMRGKRQGLSARAVHVRAWGGPGAPGLRRRANGGEAGAGVR